MRKIGILTGGGDCPGLNAVIRGVVEKCAEAGMEVFGFRDGWRGGAERKGTLAHAFRSGRHTDPWRNHYRQLPNKCSCSA